MTLTFQIHTRQLLSWIDIFFNYVQTVTPVHKFANNQKLNVAKPRQRAETNFSRKKDKNQILCNLNRWFWSWHNQREKNAKKKVFSLQSEREKVVRWAANLEIETGTEFRREGVVSEGVLFSFNLGPNCAKIIL